MSRLDATTTTTTTTPLQITHPRILRFYQENPALHFETTNLLIVDIFEKLLLDMKYMTDPATATATKHQIKEIKDILHSLKDQLHTNQTASIQEIHQIKADYLVELQNVLSMNHNYDKIMPILEKMNTHLMEKTIASFTREGGSGGGEPISELHKQIQDSLLYFQKSISEDIQAFLPSSNCGMVDGSHMTEFLNKIDSKMTTMILNIQDNDTMMKEIYENQEKQEKTHNKIMSDLTDLLQKFRNNHQMQAGHDAQLSILLSRIFNSGDITIHKSDDTTGSFLLKRLRKPTIFIQNKDQIENVGIDDVNCFLQSTEEQNCSGVFISQQSGISLKKDFQIEFHSNNIVLFLHNVEYSPIKIETAVSIIDSLTSKLRLLKFDGNSNTSHSIPKDILDTINGEYQLFISQKNAVIDVFKESQKKVLSQIDEIRFPCLDKYLSTKYTTPIIKSGLKCVLCNCYSANNLKALAAHKRGCIRKLKNTLHPTTNGTGTTHSEIPNISIEIASKK
jgi:hypothetical protein